MGGRWLGRLLRASEDTLAVLFLGLMVALSAGEVIARQVFDTSIPGATVYVQQFNLVLAMVGAVIAARSGRHLSLSLAHAFEGRSFYHYFQLYSALVAAVVLTALTWGGIELVKVEIGGSTLLEYGVPVWIFEAVLAAGFAFTGLRLVTRDTRWWQVLIIGAAAGGLLWKLQGLPWDGRAFLAWPGTAALLVGLLVGTPIFVIMGGFACLFFFIGDIPVSAVPVETYHIVSSATLPVIPLFTFAGYLLANGGASKRLVRLFTAAVGWLPGGVAAATVLVCAFFTTFTGASGVTILGLGGLLLPILVGAGYTEAFALGLITCAGSLGMLFPPSLPVILYGVTAHIPIDTLFIGGIVPGFVLMALVMAYGVFVGLRSERERTRFSRGELFEAVLEARWEILLPVVIFAGIFGGVLTLTEAAAVTTVYVFIVEVVLKKSLSLRKDIPGVMVESATVVGGLMVIFGVALGMTSYLVDAEIPMKLTAWVQENIERRWLFILAINLFLLITGSLMEGFSAIVILVPLIAPIGASFGFHPVHLGILFLANLEMGFLLPPVGLNLFLSSMRFQKRLTSLYRPILPFLIITGIGVLLISYVPWFSTMFVGDAPMPDPTNFAP